MALPPASLPLSHWLDLPDSKSTMEELWMSSQAVSLSPVRRRRGFAEVGPEGDRPFVLSRSFFAGTQRLGPIWTGDNRASWEFLRLSLAQLLSLNVAGLHFVGRLSGCSLWPGQQLPWQAGCLVHTPAASGTGAPCSVAVRQHWAHSQIATTTAAQARPAASAFPAPQAQMWAGSMYIHSAPSSLCAGSKSALTTPSSGATLPTMPCAVSPGYLARKSPPASGKPSGHGGWEPWNLSYVECRNLGIHWGAEQCLGSEKRKTSWAACLRLRGEP